MGGFLLWSQLDPERCESPFEEWAAVKNNKGLHFSRAKERLHRLRQDYFAIFKQAHGNSSEPVIEVITSDEESEGEGF